MTRRLSSLLGCVLGLATLACDGGTPCDASRLEAALAAAEAGDTVTVGACTLAGAFRVPAGVALVGVGDATVLASIEGGAPVVRVDEGGRLAALTVRVEHGGVGVRGAGASTLVLDDVGVEVTRGMGIGLDATAAELTHVRVHGPVTAANVATASLDPDETGTFGIVGRALGDHEVTLDDVHLDGFAIAAVSLTEGVLAWTGRASGADVEATRGVGLALFGTSATLDSVEIAGMLGGPGMPGVAISCATSGARPGACALGDVHVHDGEGYGLFSDRAQPTLAGARFEHLGLAGIRLQGGTLEATDLICDGNGGAGLLAVDATSVDVERGELSRTITRGFVTSTGTVPSGEGVQLVRATPASAPPIALRLVDVQLVDDERAGLLLDAASGAVASLELTRVQVSGQGTSLGAVGQNVTLPGGWDADVTRSGATAANDAAFAGSIPVQGIMMPPGLVASAPAF